ncbi:MAG: hypothetical protein Q9210_006173, partial [Variospora velana]
SQPVMVTEAMFSRMMYPAFVAAAFFLALARPVVSTTPTPAGLVTREFPPGASKIQADLGPELCKGASIYFPSSLEFGEYTERWSIAAEGDILVVVVPGCQRDVATAVSRFPNQQFLQSLTYAKVKFANSFNLPFLAINRGHGTPSALGTIKHGVLIKMTSLDSIDIAADGNTATMGGGVYTDQALAKLAESNKVCGTEPHLLDVYMGYAGLISDNIVEMDVVTANGSEIKVSATSNPDLYWGMRGAGHNFGIVTKFQYKIFDYPKGQDTYYVTYFFTEDKLEAFFKQLNQLLNDGNMPKDINTYALYLINPSISPQPVILFQLYYFGTPDQALPYVQPFLNLDPVIASNATTAYKNLAHEATGTGVGDPLCAGGTTKAFYSAGLKRYNVAANRMVYEVFSDMVTRAPALNGSFVQFEGYALQGMEAVDEASSAYAHREDNHLVSFTTVYPPSPANDAAALEYGRQARRIWAEGETPPRELSVYTNYAFGDESVQQIYGYEPWRLRRLRALKEKWDPRDDLVFHVSGAVGLDPSDEEVCDRWIRRWERDTRIGSRRLYYTSDDEVAPYGLGSNFSPVRLGLD